MEIYQIIFEIFLYLSEGIIIFYYSRSMFEQKYATWIVLAWICTGYLTLFAVYKLDSAYLNVMAILIIDILIFVFMFNCNIKIAVFHAILLIVIMAACEWILIFIISVILKQDFNAYQNNYYIHIINIVSSKLVYYIICVVLANLFSKRKRQNKNKSIFWVLLIMPLTSIVVLLAIRYATFQANLSYSMNIIFSVASALLLISNIIIFFIYEASISNAEKLFEFQTIEQKKEIDKQYFDILEKNNKDLKIFTHDIKNHLEQISNLTEDKEISNYISKLYGAVNQYSNVALSGNKTLDIIISKYNTICSNKNIDITFDVKTCNLSDVDSTDLTSILNNLLDNAVESAEKCIYKRNIIVEIYTKQAFEVVKIQNSCDIAPNIRNKKLLTSKNDKSIHGLGIESVKRTLKKYNGIFEWIYDDTKMIFETTIAIPRTNN